MDRPYYINSPIYNLYIRVISNVYKNRVRKFFLISNYYFIFPASCEEIQSEKIQLIA